jgi:hypothetical protein
MSQSIEQPQVDDRLESALKIVGRDKDPLIFIVAKTGFHAKIANRTRNICCVCLFPEVTDGSSISNSLQVLMASGHEPICRSQTWTSLSGRTLNVTASPALPAVTWKKLPDGSIEGDGVDYMMLDTVAKK